MHTLARSKIPIDTREVEDTNILCTIHTASVRDRPPRALVRLAERERERDASKKIVFVAKEKDR